MRQQRGTGTRPSRQKPTRQRRHISGQFFNRKGPGCGEGWPPCSPATGWGTSQCAPPPRQALVSRPVCCKCAERPPCKPQTRHNLPGALCVGSVPVVPTSQPRTGRLREVNHLPPKEAKAAAGPGHGSRTRRPNARSRADAKAPCRLVHNTVIRCPAGGGCPP